MQIHLEAEELLLKKADVDVVVVWYRQDDYVNNVF